MITKCIDDMTTGSFETRVCVLSDCDNEFSADSFSVQFLDSFAF